MEPQQVTVSDEPAIARALEDLKRALDGIGIKPKQAELQAYIDCKDIDVLFTALPHLSWLCDRAAGDLERGCTLEVARTLGVIQGAMWALGLYDIEAIQDAMTMARQLAAKAALMNDPPDGGPKGR